MFDRKAVPWWSVLDLSVVYVGYIVLGNLSIKLNPVGFYQIVKALIPPAVLAVTSIQTASVPSGNVMAAVGLLTVGVIAATVTDDEVMGNLPGMLMGVACVFATAGYNVLAGSKQKQLAASALPSSPHCLCCWDTASGTCGRHGSAWSLQRLVVLHLIRLSSVLALVWNVWRQRRHTYPHGLSAVGQQCTFVGLRMRHIPLPATTTSAGIADSSQLCLCFSPLAAAMLLTALPLLEPAAVMSFFRPWAPDAAAAPSFQATPAAILVVLLSAALGLLVTLSTFLVIGATSALTYNVVGHIKTVGVIAGGVLFYGEVRPRVRLLQVVLVPTGHGSLCISHRQPAHIFPCCIALPSGSCLRSIRMCSLWWRDKLGEEPAWEVCAEYASEEASRSPCHGCRHRLVQPHQVDRGAAGQATCGGDAGAANTVDSAAKQQPGATGLGAQAATAAVRLAADGAVAHRRADEEPSAGGAHVGGAGHLASQGRPF